MQNLTSEEIASVDGGIIPAIYAGIMTYNYVVAVYSTTQIVAATGAVVGFTSAVAAALD